MPPFEEDLGVLLPLIAKLFEEDLGVLLPLIAKLFEEGPGVLLRTAPPSDRDTTRRCCRAAGYRLGMGDVSGRPMLDVGVSVSAWLRDWFGGER